MWLSSFYSLGVWLNRGLVEDGERAVLLLSLWLRFWLAGGRGPTELRLGRGIRKMLGQWELAWAAEDPAAAPYLIMHASGD